MAMSYLVPSVCSGRGLLAYLHITRLSQYVFVLSRHVTTDVTDVLPLCVHLAQRMLLMKDAEVVLGHCDSGSAIEIENATLAWEKPVAEKEKSDKPSTLELVIDL